MGWDGMVCYAMLCYAMLCYGPERRGWVGVLCCVVLVREGREGREGVVWGMVKGDGEKGGKGGELLSGRRRERERETRRIDVYK